jgi:hypothetical protein
MSSLSELRKLHPEFEVHAQAFPDYWGPLFQSPELDRFEVLPEFTAIKGGVPLPDRTRELMHLPAGAAPFVGAYDR